MALNGTFRTSVGLTNTRDDIDLSLPSESVSENINKTISTGKLWHDQLSLSASQITSIDLNDGSLTDVYGEAVTLSGITGLYIKADSTNAGDFIVSGGPNAFLNDQPALGASEGLGFMTDIDITSSSKLYIVNGATSGLVDIIVSGNE